MPRFSNVTRPCTVARMAKPGDTYPLHCGVEVRFIQAPSENGYRLLELEFEVPVGQRLLALPHRHPDIEEHFAIVRGTARHRLGRRRLVARAGDAWVVPAGRMHVHPSNIGDEPLVVHQWLQRDAPDERLLGGLERYVEALSAIAAQGKLDRFGRVTDPLQDAVTTSETLLPGSYLPVIPTALQRALVSRAAAIGRRRGRVAVPH